MRIPTTAGTRHLPALLLFTALLALAGSPAQAQVDPTWDHYKAYIVNPHPSFSTPVTLIDQFQATSPQTQFLDWFANPVEKRHDTAVYPINRPELHYAWWVLQQEPPFSKDVIAINQFGTHPIHVGSSPFGDFTYLLNPALKNAPAGFPLPVANHYKCYPCSGDPVDAKVFLTDQFLSRPALVFVPRFFCTPVEKRLPDGRVFPMVNPNQHYVVYDMDFTNQPFPASIRDQFLLKDTPVNLLVDRLLMVPTLKEFPTPAQTSTWGKMKALFR